MLKNIVRSTQIGLVQSTQGWSPTDVPFSATDVSDMVAWWKCNEGTGTVVADSSGNVNNMNISAGVTWDGASLRFPGGVSSYLSKTYNATFDLSNITFTAWCFIENNGGSSHFLFDHGLLGGAGNEKGFSLRFDANFYAQWNVGSGAGNRLTITATSAGSFVGSWKLVTCTYELNNILEIYVNDTRHAFANTSAGLTKSTDTITIGFTGTSNIIQGWFKDIRVYNRRLLSDEVALLYNAGAIQ